MLVVRPEDRGRRWPSGLHPTSAIARCSWWTAARPGTPPSGRPSRSSPTTSTRARWTSWSCTTGPAPWPGVDLWDAVVGAATRARRRDPGGAGDPAAPRGPHARSPRRWAPSRRPRRSVPPRCWRPTAPQRRTASRAPTPPACVAAYRDIAVAAVPSTALNLKVTFPEDVATRGRAQRCAVVRASSSRTSSTEETRRPSGGARERLDRDRRRPGRPRPAQVARRAAPPGCATHARPGSRGARSPRRGTSRSSGVADPAVARRP